LLISYFLFIVNLPPAPLLVAGPAVKEETLTLEAVAEAEVVTMAEAEAGTAVAAVVDGEAGTVVAEEVEGLTDAGRPVPITEAAGAAAEEEAEGDIDPDLGPTLHVSRRHFASFCVAFLYAWLNVAFGSRVWRLLWWIYAFETT
jgi:hypothetical protein